MTEEKILIPPTSTLIDVIVESTKEYYYAQIDLDTNIVIGISHLHSASDNAHMIELEVFDNSVLGKVYNSKTKLFEVAPDMNTYLHITTPEPTTINTDITVTVDVKDASGKLIPVAATYYVPVMRTSDNYQAILLVVNLVDGKASNTFQIKDQGIYTIKLDNISPKPTSILQSNVELIVV